MKTKSGIINLILLSFIFTSELNATPNTDLLESAANFDLPKLESTLTAGADINYADSENRTALYFAYEKEKTGIISYLKKNGAKETNLTKIYRIEKNCAKNLTPTLMRLSDIFEYVPSLLRQQHPQWRGDYIYLSDNFYKIGVR